MTLPGAHFAKKETALNKLAFYEKADEDSAKLLERMKQDPYHLKLNTSAASKKRCRRVRRSLELAGNARSFHQPS